MKNTTADVAALSYEDARDELISIVAKLETGSATLDESLGLWERGEALAARCKDLLDGARGRITDARGETDSGMPPTDATPVPDGDAARNVAGDEYDAGVIGVVPSQDDDE